MSEPTNEQCRQMLFAMAEGDDNSLAAWATRRITALEQKVAELIDQIQRAHSMATEGRILFDSETVLMHVTVILSPTQEDEG